MGFPKSNHNMTPSTSRILLQTSTLNILYLEMKNLSKICRHHLLNTVKKTQTCQNKDADVLMIRRTRFLLFLSLILGSSVLLGISAFYQTDTYRSLSFTFEITEIRVIHNETSGRFQRVNIVGRIHNPSFTIVTDLIHSDTHIFLNGQQLYYGFGFKGGRTIIPPGESRPFSYYYSLTDDDQTLFLAAESSGNWNWFLFLEPLVQTTFLAETNNGRLELYRSLAFFEATMVPV